MTGDILFGGVIYVPRSERVKSKSGIYHVLLRGINQETVFHDEEDCRKFLEILKNCRDAAECKIFGYCVMSNHVHILLNEGKEGLPQIIKRIGVRFVSWYNKKYGRSGPLFQDRYKSEPVDSGRYFLTALRFIHQNPQKAWIASKLENYKFSSYADYLKKDGELIDFELAYQMLGDEEFARFSNELNDDMCLECNDFDMKLSDEEARDIIKRAAECSDPGQVASLPKKERDRLIAEFRAAGMSIRQICRLTGVSFGVARKYK